MTLSSILIVCAFALAARGLYVLGVPEWACLMVLLYLTFVVGVAQERMRVSKVLSVMLGVAGEKKP